MFISLKEALPDKSRLARLERLVGGRVAPCYNLCQLHLPRAKNYFINLPGRRNLEGLELANTLVDSIIEKKGSNILLLDIRDQAIFSDYFILCNGDSDRQIKALADAVVADAKEQAGVRPWGREGDAETGWVLVDFGNIVIHLFSPEKRNYYNLEELWSDAHVILRMP
ncbi:MAG: ribosome silencing factor [Candidatus Promineifilaceae bacterium]|nr:ribosome silencing factor [Candidatus Promineifilaceae bacterium]